MLRLVNEFIINMATVPIYSPSTTTATEMGDGVAAVVAVGQRALRPYNGNFVTESGTGLPRVWCARTAINFPAIHLQQPILHFSCRKKCTFDLELVQ